MTALDSCALIRLGFREIGHWQLGTAPRVLTYAINKDPDFERGGILDEPQALYAFVSEAQVLYVGKTARTARQRLMGYCRPGSTQLTNIRCNKLIQEYLAKNERITILIFRTAAKLKYGDFDLDIAAGLEDSLIAAFKPPWNGSDKGRIISEEAEREFAEPAMPNIKAVDTEHQHSTPETSDLLGWKYAFEIKLGKAYYYQGIINPGVGASRHLGKEGEPISVVLGLGGEVVKSKIDRTANPGGAVRLVGSNKRFAEWFQKHFKFGDVVKAKVLNSQRVQKRYSPDSAAF